jgi:hypothetical protein
VKVGHNVKNKFLQSIERNFGVWTQTYVTTV